MSPIVPEDIGDLIKRATPGQIKIMDRFSKLAGRVYYLAEAALSDKEQLRAFKKLVGEAIYDLRNDLLRDTLEKEK